VHIDLKSEIRESLLIGLNLRQWHTN